MTVLRAQATLIPTILHHHQSLHTRDFSSSNQPREILCKILALSDLDISSGICWQRELSKETPEWQSFDGGRQLCADSIPISPGCVH